MIDKNFCLWVAVFAFSLAALLRLLVCVKAIALAIPIDGFFVALGAAFFAGAFLVA